MLLYYTLNEAGEPVAVRDVIEWARRMERVDRNVAKTEIGPFLVSTVFLGLDHSFDGGAPIVWETMVFSGNDRLGDHQERCSGNRADALAMHERVCASVRNPKWPPDETTRR